MSRAVLFWVAVLFLFAGSVALWAGYSYLNSGLADPPPQVLLPDGPLQSFKLFERSGREFDSKELKGKPWVASFFFASCPGFCPAQNEIVSKLALQWGPRGVKWVSITVDPDRDTPSVLSDYARRFNADKDNWLFLTGPMPMIDRIGKDIFNVSVAKETHSGHLLVVDGTGKLRGRFKSMSKADVQQMEEFLEELLAEEQQKEEPKKETPAKESPQQDDKPETNPAQTEQPSK